MKIIKRIFLVLLVVVALAGIGFVVWAETPLGPEPEALAALESDSQVTVTIDDYITFATYKRRADNRLYLLPRRPCGLSFVCRAVA